MSRVSLEGMRFIPSIHEMLEAEEIKEYQQNRNLSHNLLKENLQEAADHLRQAILHHGYEVCSKEEALHKILTEVKDRLAQNQEKLQKVVNATGTVLHTNLGRARLSSRAARHAMSAATSYSNLEYDLETGNRGSRHTILEELLIKATGAEAAIAVNNNAAAVYFILSAFAKNKEVLVSRGELVEIGGSFRVSSIMEESGAELVEVGTTNKTRASDYLSGLTEETAMAMKVHTSNFAIIGFTESVSSAALKQHLTAYDRDDVIVYDDLGSGSLFPFREEGIGDEPVVKNTLHEGADIISFSGDKLLGGPQAGIIAGKKSLIDQLKKHQLARVLRLDKMTLAALETTLHDFIYHENPAEALPVLRDITATQTHIRNIALKRVKELNLHHLKITVADDISKVGGGTMPLVELPTAVLLVEKQSWSAGQVEEFLRKMPVPVLGRIQRENYHLDMRTVDDSDWEEIISGLKALDEAL